MKHLLISRELFTLLVRFHLLGNDSLKENIQKELQDKLDALITRDLYTKYKTSPTEIEKEQARQEYLDKKGYLPDFRW